MQALMLAAGLGKRLAKYTKNNTKCMVEVAGRKLIDHAIEAIKNAGIKRFVVVVGYKGENLKTYLKDNYEDELELVFIDNPVFDKTNNIYSFYLAKEELVKDDTILLESDIIFDKNLISDLVALPESEVVVVAKYKSWMDGTCVKLNDNKLIYKFVDKDLFNQEHINEYYKTVNLYKFSKEFLKETYLPFLETYMKLRGTNSYYETSLKLICQLPNIKLRAYDLENRPWYEIDDSQDLEIANVIFSTGSEKLNLLEKKYGGYWRYPGLLDFCYLVNPYFPTKEMIEKFKTDFQNLLTQYPSGHATQAMNVERLFGVNSEYILVGNGAAELINALGHAIGKKKIAINIPVFNEYIRCFKECEITEIDSSIHDYKMDLSSIKKSIDNNDFVAIVNPDNPSGFMLCQDEILDLIEYSHSKNKSIIIDESFVDFANKEYRFTLLNDDLLSKYPNLIVIKSISKSFGVPGLRLGILATSNIVLLKQMHDEMPIWNINSFGEYFLQIYHLYSKMYFESCDKIAEQRLYMINELSKIKGIKVYPSQANYLLLEIKNMKSHDFALKMLEQNFFIKDLSTKYGFKDKQFVRIAIRDSNDNEQLLNSIKNLFHKT